MSISRNGLFQLFKYLVYFFLAMNVYWFFAQEYLAAQLQFPHGVGPGDMIEAYAATIDTAAWVVLLLMFELETYVLDERHFTGPVTLTLHGLRAICYAFIIYAFYGYIVNALFLAEVSETSGITGLCTMATGQWSYAVGLDDYIAITAANCNSFSAATSFYLFDSMQAVVDADGLRAITILAWVDVINAAVWLLVVLVLELDVQLQERDRYEGLALRLSNIVKVVLYTTLLLAAIYWGVKGDFVDFWDAFLWLVAFVFIELNVFEWRKEVIDEKLAAEQA
ncbi:MAG: hypothetical protein OEM51_02675 [Gammaproteobacteria bacterium]|nr:hypothetical protein [Gammaproteobacteria bacterium]